MIRKYGIKIVVFLWATALACNALTFTGTVIDSLTGKAIGGVKVGTMDSASGIFSQFVLTNSNGSFSLMLTPTSTLPKPARFKPFSNSEFQNTAHEYRDFRGAKIKNSAVAQNSILLVVSSNSNSDYKNENEYKSEPKPSVLSKTSKNGVTGVTTLVFALTNYSPRYLDFSGSQNGIELKLKMNMVPIPAGSFTMGQVSIAEPPHQVNLKAFAMQETEVTQEQFKAVTGKTPSHFNSGSNAQNLPVEMVNWFEAIKYCNVLSKMCGLDIVYDTATWAMDTTKNGYRLPTEAEWEYASRAGTATKYFWDKDSVGKYAWYSGNSNSTTHPVATKRANAWGLFDMVGNVWEWCYDFFSVYSQAEKSNPIVASGGSLRIVRGGGWGLDSLHLTSAFRGAYAPAIHDYNFYAGGFRTVRSIPN